MGEKRAYNARKPGGGRKKLKPEYDAGENLKEQMDAAVALYEEDCDALWKVMSIIISEPEQVPFFMFKRFGLRKINQCFLRDINRLNEYFEPSHYHVFRIQGEDNIKEKVMQIRDSLEIAGYNANLIRTLVRGELRGEEAYQVNYDADMYLIDSQSIKELMENKEKIMQMNDWLFELHKDAVTETFLNQLIDGSFDKDMIIGVEANGEDTV